MINSRNAFVVPLLVATVPILFFAVQNTSQIAFSDPLGPLVVVYVGTLILFFTTRMVIHDSTRVALILSVLIVAFFSYGRIYEAFLDDQGIPMLRHRYLIPIYGFTSLSLVAGLLVYRRSLINLLQGVLFVSFVLVIVNLTSISIEYFNPPDIDLSDSPSIIHITSVDSDFTPDVYYIILDSYGRSDVLTNTHDYDNQNFVDFLTDAGFRVLSESTTNYTGTRASLTSALNMDFLSKQDDIDSLFQQSVVFNAFNELGYATINLDSDVGLTRVNRSAERNLKTPGNLFQSTLVTDFTRILLRTTAARILAAGIVNYDRYFIQRSARAFNNNMTILPGLSDISEPVFVFNHNLPPHPPFIFDQNGRVRSTTEYAVQGNISRRTDEYIDQLLYVNSRIQDVVIKLLDDSRSEPIIIIQGDHGPDSTLDSGEDPSQLYIYERSGILNAIYLPDRCDSQLYQEMSPVNLFRMIFNSCFGTSFEKLPDLMFYVLDRRKNVYLPVQPVSPFVNE